MTKASVIPHIRASYGKMTRSKKETKEIEKRINRGLSEGTIFKITGDNFG